MSDHFRKPPPVISRAFKKAGSPEPDPRALWYSPADPHKTRAPPCPCSVVAPIAHHAHRLQWQERLSRHKRASAGASGAPTAMKRARAPPEARPSVDCSSSRRAWGAGSRVTSDGKPVHLLKPRARELLGRRLPRTGASLRIARSWRWLPAYLLHEFAKLIDMPVAVLQGSGFRRQRLVHRLG